MIWDKKGLVFCADNQFDWMSKFATLPIAIHLEDDLYRIYFSTRDKSNCSHAAFIEIDINSPNKINRISSKPLLSPGKIGLFDDSGVQPCSILFHDNKLYMYYAGWCLSSKIPFHTYLGLSISEDNLNFTKVSKVPILDRSNIDPYSIGWCFVMKENNKFVMWYESNIDWKNSNSRQGQYFNIKYATSDDGINWKREGVVCLDLLENETILSRPSVLFDNGIYKMWYSYKQNYKYRIGYAESNNGIRWERKDKEVGIHLSDSGWDSEEIEYPFVFKHKSDIYMLYNGNGYGRSGFGIAKLIQ